MSAIERQLNAEPIPMAWKAHDVINDTTADFSVDVILKSFADAALAEALDLAAHWKSLAEQERAKVRDMEEFLTGMKMPWGGP